MIYVRPTSIELSSGDYFSLYDVKENAKQKLFNIGAGAWKHDFWTNIDLPPQTEAFAAIQEPCIFHDLITQRSLPILSDSADAFYCSHVVEHLTESAVLNLMMEAYRCLETGGIFRIVTGPCCDLDWSALLRKDKKWWYWFAELSKSVKKDMHLMTIYDKWLYSVATPRSLWSETNCEKKYYSDEIIELVDEYREKPYILLDRLTNGLNFDYSAPGNHISWWNSVKLIEFLGQAGFKDIKKSAFGQSESVLMRDLRYFDQTYPQISVYVEARK
jgi:predicted SAM-dependent methyltransferase